ncbi:hypothetical protein [Sphingosinicella terrae]|uniref:hypothetical protein n=1 Tax=Sphingosinicella terrae TaxID=2172047 RepID=UPI002548F85A|nr:hypothetical protein [Sphingosinicella terrae]
MIATIIRVLLILLAAAMPHSPLLAAPSTELEGRWAMRAGGRTFLIIELVREGRAWSGRWLRLKHFSLSGGSSGLLLSDPSGPVIEEQIIAVEAGDTLQLTVPQDSGESADEFILRLIAPDAITLSIIGAPLPPYPLYRAGPEEIVAFEWPRGAHAVDQRWTSNAEIAELYAADQAARRDPVLIDWAVVSVEDRRRRARVRELLDAGELASGEDFRQAAFIFQHGASPDDYLLAHSLAVVAVARGRPDATWIAAAALDRYLQAIERPQIFGTQFRSPPGAMTTQEPYDRSLVPDALRQALGVPAQAEQDAQRVEFETQQRERQRLQHGQRQ